MADHTKSSANSENKCPSTSPKASQLNRSDISAQHGAAVDRVGASSIGKITVLGRAGLFCCGAATELIVRRIVDNQHLSISIKITKLDNEESSFSKCWYCVGQAGGHGYARTSLSSLKPSRVRGSASDGDPIILINGAVVRRFSRDCATVKKEEILIGLVRLL